MKYSPKLSFSLLSLTTRQLLPVWDTLDAQVAAMGYFLLELNMDETKSASEEAIKTLS